MLYQIIADILVIVHFLFILFVIFGGFLVLRWRFVFWIHIPCAMWGMLIEFAGWLCPITPLENHFRHLAGQAGYHGGFINHYIMPVIYPAGLTRDIQYLLGTGVLIITIIAYSLVIYQRMKQNRPGNKTN